jgi:hypothetical protein
VINDLGVLTDSRMTFVNHIESILSKSARIMGFIKRISKEYASCVWSPHQEVHSASIEHFQHNIIRFALRSLGWLLSLCLLIRADASCCGWRF